MDSSSTSEDPSSTLEVYEESETSSEEEEEEGEDAEENEIETNSEEHPFYRNLGEGSTLNRQTHEQPSDTSSEIFGPTRQAQHEPSESNSDNFGLTGLFQTQPSETSSDNFRPTQPTSLLSLHLPLPPSLAHCPGPRKNLEEH
jgi:hypothetical protein